MNVHEVAADVVRSRFGGKATAWLCGSHATGDATSRSDVDILVVLLGAEPFRETFRHHHALIELFVHTEASAREWYERESLEYRCTLANMLATGASLWPTPTAAPLQDEAKAHVSAGPPPRSQAVLEAQRYHLSAAIDDLRGCANPDELVLISASVVEQAAQLELATCRSWTGSGKWLHWWLSVVAPETASRLASSVRVVPDDRRPLETVALEVLGRAGGWLQEGYRLS